MQTIDDLARALLALPPAPRDHGRVTMIVSRPKVDERQKHLTVALTPEGGVTGDRWHQKPNTEAQISVIRHDVIHTLAGQVAPEWAGDNLHVELDLSLENLPPETRLQIGELLLEITPKKHTGCHKFRSRFGAPALDVMNDPRFAQWRLRGLFCRVIKGGNITVGDPISVVRPG